MDKVLTIGTFDTPHVGHAALFKQCERLGDLIVGVNTDDFVLTYKGKAPLYNQYERSQLIEKLGYRTRYNTEHGRLLIELMRPKYLVIGSDWARKDYLKQINVDQDWLDERDITLVYVPYTRGISSTDLKERIGEGSNSSDN